ncbi:FkbM family methyltransferase [Rhizobium esperanzae]|uniref:FkbM family methyltransferase n=1 Tax=Rhizobium esperanzae TaxID=1967781 RepID=A0A7W6R2L3_9HYPH|nr:FkbM family methyltransferase [Rhizobium esperanzae]MBB4235102.1 FkbM family methyltransferase [Rhizobium esperanzae]
MQADLIYDVGVNDGSDSSYYLGKGFRVVGIEAHPGLAQTLQQRFSSEIAAGRYTLLNLGVADQDGTMPFWVCDDVSEWSSFNRDIASRDGSRHHEVHVSTRPFIHILAEHGVPYYCKIDIEGNDRFCLDGISPNDAPAFVSIEMSHRNGSRDLAQLEALGYRRFKILNQLNFTPALPWLVSLSRPARVKRRLDRFYSSRFGKREDEGWVFPPGSSGPFADGTPGRWQSLAQAIATWGKLKKISDKAGSLNVWFDIHATR